LKLAASYGKRLSSSYRTRGSPQVHPVWIPGRRFVKDDELRGVERVV
jgi:hypothetical protein